MKSLEYQLLKTLHLAGWPLAIGYGIVYFSMILIQIWTFGVRKQVSSHELNLYNYVDLYLFNVLSFVRCRFFVFTQEERKIWFSSSKRIQNDIMPIYWVIDVIYLTVDVVLVFLLYTEWQRNHFARLKLAHLFLFLLLFHFSLVFVVVDDIMILVVVFFFY